MFGLSKSERLDKAVKLGEWNKARRLVASGAVAGRETLEEAVYSRMAGADDLKVLIDGGATPTGNMLHIAATLDDFAKAEVLAAAGIVPLPDTLRFAVNSLGNAEWVKLLIDAGAEPTSLQLYDAMRARNLAVARALVAGGASSDRMMRDHAAANLNKEWVTLLDKAKCPPTAANLYKAVYNQKWNEARGLIADGAKPDDKTLSYAAGNRDSDWIKLLLEARGGATPAMMDAAVRALDVKMVNILLKAGIVPSGEALAFTVENKMPKWAEAFIRAGAKPTPAMLHFTIRNLDAAMANVLLGAGVVPAEETLQYVIEKKIGNCAQVFIGKGAKPTPEMLDIALRNRDAETMNLLLSAGVIPAEKSVAYALEKKLGNCAEIFIAKGAVPTQALMDLAIDKGNMAAAKALKDKFAAVAAAQKPKLVLRKSAARQNTNKRILRKSNGG